MRDPQIVVLMGVSGSGKTTIGRLLAERTGAVFADADDFHSAANKEKMASGTPLTDEDRQPWLRTLNALLLRWLASRQSGILACSALKEGYRSTLMAELTQGSVQWVFLDGSKEMIAERLAARNHEYMTGKLLDSQFSILERPQAAIRVLNDRPLEVVVDEILSNLR